MKKKILIPIIVLLIIFILNFQAISDFIFLDNSWEATHTVYFEGYELHLRAPFEKANQTPIYPDEDSLKSLFFNENLEKITIVIISNDTINGYYGVVSYGLAYKLPIIIKQKTGKTITVEAMGVNNTEEAKALSTPETPVIMLLHPTLSNRTAVTIENNTIFLEGESLELVKNDYFDLDLAAGKLMLTLMEEYQTMN
jgi:hypothetical protein